MVRVYARSITRSTGAPLGFWGSGENGYLFSGSLGAGGGGVAPQAPLVNSKFIYFRTNMLIKIDRREKYGN